MFAPRVCMARLRHANCAARQNASPLRSPEGGSMPTLALAESRIHYEVNGDGYPVLLSAPGFLNSRIERWRTNPARPAVPQDFLDPIEGLSSGFRTIALDIRNA